MKTSKKLLIGLIGFIFLSTLAFLTFVRINIEGILNPETSHEILPSEEYVNQEWEMDAFDKLTTNFSGRIYFYTTENTYKIDVKTPESISSNLNISNIGGTLNIESDKNMAEYRLCEVHIYAPTLQEINLEGVLRFEADQLNTENCYINISSGHFIAGIDMKNCMLKLRNGAMVTIDGSSDILNIESLNGSILNGNGLITNSATISAYEGSKIELDSTQILYVELNQGSILSIKGNPDIKKKDIKNGVFTQSY